MYTDLKIYIPDTLMPKLFDIGPGNPPTPNQARILIAILNDRAGKPLPSSIFNYNDAGTTIHGMAPVRFSVFKEGVRFFGIGRRGADLIEEQGHVLKRLLSDSAGIRLNESRSSGQNRIRYARQAVHYRARSIIFENHHNSGIDRQALTFTPKDVELPQVVPAVLKATKSSIIRQVTELHGDDPTVLMGEDGFDVNLDDINLEVVSIEKLAQYNVTQFNAPRASELAAVNVILRSNVDLDGVWNVGRLCAKDYGHLYRAKGIQ